MITTKKKTKVYKAFGLKIETNINFPELEEQIIPHLQTDVIIVREENYGVPLKQSWIIKNKEVTFEVEKIARFTIRDGNQIKVTPFKGFDEQIANIYILGSCFGVLLFQRKIFPLHGSAIAIEGKAYLFIGEQGAGKSTIAATFLKHGYQLISDDVIPIIFNTDKIPMVTSAYPQQKLWDDTLNKVGKGTTGLRSIYGRERKYCVPVSENFCNATLPLGGIFELVKKDKGEFEIIEIQGLRNLNILSTHTYRNHLIHKMELMEWHFDIITQLINRVKVYQINRPEGIFTAESIKSVVLSKIKSVEESIYEQSDKC